MKVVIDAIKNYKDRLDNDIDLFIRDADICAFVVFVLGISVSIYAFFTMVEWK